MQNQTFCGIKFILSLVNAEIKMLLEVKHLNMHALDFLIVH